NIRDNIVSSSNNGNQFNFRLLDSESEQPLRNIEIRIPDYEKLYKKKSDKKNRTFCGYGGFSKEDTKIIKTNEEGFFYLPDKTSGRKFVRTLYIPKMNSSLTFRIFDNKLVSTIYREGFGRVQAIGKNTYDLDSTFVEKVRYYDDEISVESFDQIDLFSVQGYYRPKDLIANINREYYTENHLELWEFLWKDFESIVGDDILIHPNTEIWNQYVFRVFYYFKDVDVNPLIDIYRQTTATEKKYNILHAIIKVRDFRIRKNKEVVLSEDKAVKALLEVFYEENSEFIERISNFMSVGDYLKRELIKNEKMYYNNAEHFPNVKKRLKLVSN
ncbi:MAG: hypothetical protein ACI86M_002302, partial [Saprospiraceae bacterium]